MSISLSLISVVIPKNEEAFLLFAVAGGDQKDGNTIVLTQLYFIFFSLLPSFLLYY